MTRSVWLRGGFALVLLVNAVINVFEGDWVFAVLNLLVALLLAGSAVAVAWSSQPGSSDRPPRNR